MLPSMKAICRAPILIFQMGKVGSSSLETTLARRLPNPVIHAHTLAGLTAGQQRCVTWRRRLHLPVYVISPVREPIARNVSAFFQNFQRDTGMELTSRQWTVPELCELFLERYPHHTCLEWFDAHLRPTFGIDVLAEPFPIAQKWRAYRQGSVRLLVYRTDLEHTRQLEVVGQFLGCKLDAWDYANRSQDKEFAELYKAFCASATLPDVYLRLMHDSRFARTFWSAGELATHATRWRHTT